MYDVLDTQIPDMNQSVGKNAAGRDVTCEQLAQDIVSDYKWLYSNSKTLAGSKSLEEIHNSNQYKDFAAKLRFMYTAVGDTFDASVSYPWVTYLFTGMTPAEVQDLAGRSHRYWSEYGKFTEETWTSPFATPGQAGVVNASYLTGITFTDEVVDLYQTLSANGIDVYVLSLIHI